MELSDEWDDASYDVLVFVFPIPNPVMPPDC